MNTAIATRPKQDIDAPAPGGAKRDPRAVGDLRHMTVGYSAGCAAARARAGLGAPTRKRRSDSDIAPPSTMTAARRLHDPDHLAAAPYREFADEFPIIGPGTRDHAVEGQIVVADRHRFARTHRGDPLGAPLGFADDSQHRQSDPEMRNHGTPGRARQTAGTPDHSSERGPEQARALHEIGERRVGKECRSRWSPYH